MNKHSAIYKLYPNVITIRGNVAYNKAEQEVNYDNAAVEALVASEAYKEKRAAELFIANMLSLFKRRQLAVSASSALDSSLIRVAQNNFTTKPGNDHLID